MYHYTCPVCQKQFSLYDSRKKYCSKSCYYKTKTKRKDIPYQFELMKKHMEKRTEKKDNGCWEWIGHILKGGYGQTHFCGKMMRAHRASWLIHNGEIPKEMIVCHSCDNKKCINPSHLFIGTHLDNNKDMMKKGRNKQLKEEHHNLAKLTDDKVKNIKQMIQDGEKIKNIAIIFGVTGKTIYTIRSHLNWKHID